MTFDELDAEIRRKDELLRSYRELVSKLAVATDKNEAWGVAKCWAPAKLWRSIGFDLNTVEAQQKFLFD